MILIKFMKNLQLIKNEREKMKKLKRIKLINWHLYVNQTVEITGNSLISGENGAGKSTFLDALQYVLTVGKAKFNTAANTKAKRNLEGYIRCKLGLENKTYLRSGDVTTHIALEFIDEKQSQPLIIGVCLEINKNNKINEHFYLMKDAQINDCLFIKDNYILNYRDFKKNLTDMNIDFTFFETKEKARISFLEALGINNYKYIELIPKALAFKPIDELHKFVFDFLLTEKEINLERLRDNVKKYQEFEQLIKDLQEKENKLLAIKKVAKKRDDLLNSKALLMELNDYCHYQQMLLEKYDLEKNSKKIKELIEKAIKEKEHYEFKIIKLTTEIEKIKFQQQKNKDLEYLQVLENKIYLYEREINQRSKIVYDLKEIISNEIKLLKYLDEEKNEKINIDNFAGFIEHIKNQYNEIKLKNLQEIYEINHHLEKINNKLLKINQEIYNFKNKQINLSPNIIKLKNAIEQEIKTNVKALCEVIEVSDEKWRNALEGYLNSRRFDIIVEPNFVDLALKVYEKVRLNHNIYGVGIVNTKALNNYYEINENSLASKVKTQNKWARLYINMLLNQIYCVNNSNELSNYQRSITKEGLVYQNYTYRYLNKEVYEKPFIGLNALKIQYEKALKEKEILEESKKRLEKNVFDKQLIIDKINSSQLDYIKDNLLSLKELTNLYQELEQLKIERDNYHNDDYLEKLQKTVSLKEEEVKQLEIVKSELLIKIGKLTQEYEVKKESLKALEAKFINLQEVNKLVIEYYEDLYKRMKSVDKVLKYCVEEQKNNEREIKNLEVELLTKMSQYNDLETRLDNINYYLEELEKIQNYELIKYNEELKKAKENCELAFKEQFIYQLRENIINAQNEIKQLNLALKRKKFGGDEYEFIYQASLNQEYHNYYKIIMNENVNIKLLDNLYTKLQSDEIDDVKELCDYRNYMSYDIKITNENKEVMYFSKVSREKSGGETQTPFYVVIGASFEQLIADKKETSPACFVMFDEAFNNMDEDRIKTMMTYYQQLDIQLMISVPPQRVETIFPYINTTLVVIKDNKEAFIDSFIMHNQLNHQSQLFQNQKNP